MEHTWSTRWLQEGDPACKLAKLRSNNLGSTPDRIGGEPVINQRRVMRFKLRNIPYVRPIV